MPRSPAGCLYSRYEMRLLVEQRREMLIHCCFPLWCKALSCSSRVPTLCLVFIVASFHLAASACGAVPSVHVVNRALLLLLLLLLFVLREESSGSRPTGKTRVLAQKCNAAGNVYISICVGFHWFLLCECAHVYMTTPCFSPISLFHTHTHTHTHAQMFPWQYCSHDGAVQGFTHSFINNPSVLMGAEYTLSINTWS